MDCIAARKIAEIFSSGEMRGKVAIKLRFSKFLPVCDAGF
jgi:hypothetical protein